MVFQLCSLEIHGLHGLADYQVDFSKALPESVKKSLQTLHKIMLGEKEISLLFKDNEGEECSCCDETKSEFIKVKIKVKESNHLYKYNFDIFLPHEMILEERLLKDNHLLFSKEGGQVNFPDQEMFFERNDYLHLPASKDEKLFSFRRELEKSLAKLLEIA